MNRRIRLIVSGNKECERENKMALTAHTPKGKKKGKNMADDANIGNENEDDSSRTLTISEQLIQQKFKEVTRQKKEEFDVLLKKKETVARKLTRIQVALQRPEAADKHYLQLQVKMLESAYGEYSELQNHIYDLKTSEEVRCAEEMRFIEFEELYSVLYVQLTKQIDAVVKNETEPALLQPVHNQPHIPPLKAPLPTFDGNFENWFAFKNMFQNVMARYENEAPAIKLYHLRNSLIGAAADVIDQDIINNNDYDAGRRSESVSKTSK